MTAGGAEEAEGWPWLLVLVPGPPALPATPA